MKIKVTLTATLPCIGKTVTHEQIDEWLLFNLGARGGMSMDNPLVEDELEAEPFSVEWNLE